MPHFCGTLLYKKCVYDSFGQLIRDNNKALDKTFIYSYNEIGNITSVSQYAYTTGAVSGTPVTKSFGYDTTHPDRLTSFGGKAITYDANGCVKTYDGWTYTWTRGKLTKLTKGNRTTGTNTYTYTYNAYGQRTEVSYAFTIGMGSSSAVAMGALIGYTKSFDYDSSGRLIAEKQISRYHGEESTSEKIVYLYDESRIIGIVYTDYSGTSSTYYLHRNLQGDVVGIYDASGTKVGGYAYDAWGKCTITLNTNSIVTINPIRYRGYYYDSDTKLYYLNARYYNPEWRRFISPDSTSYLDPESANGLNLYAYCYNDPVNYIDPSGTFAISTAIAVGFWIGLTVGAIAGATAGGIVSYNAAKDSGTEGWELFGCTMLGVFGGGVLGGVAGAALGSAIGYGVGLIWGSLPIAGSQGAIALWSGGQGIAGKAAASFASKTGAKLVTDTFAGKTLNIVSKILPRQFSNYLWGKLSAEFVAGASSATIFLFDGGISHNSTFYEYEIWVLLEKGIERTIHFVGN